MYIKGFDSELKCRDFQFEIGGEYRIKHTKPLSAVHSWVVPD